MKNLFKIIQRIFCVFLINLICVNIWASEVTDGCYVCHGKQGNSAEPSIPSIAGMSEGYLIDAMIVYKDRIRPCVKTQFPSGPDSATQTDMCKIADSLSNTEIQSLATYYAEQEYIPAKQDFDADRAARGKKLHLSACEKCHEDGGSVAEDDAGFLAGQWAPYLRQTLEHFQAGTRASPQKMKPTVDALSAEDIEYLLHYYSSLQ
jgi:sulfide dehydrogenase cytochrome subunit